MAMGPKKAVTAPPLDFKGWPKDRAKRRERFIREYLLVPRGHGAGKPVKLRPFQREILQGAFAPGIRTALVSLPRGNGKTAFAAMLGLAELFVGPPSAEVLVVATDQRQANITMNLARRMVELNPELAERVQIYKDRLHVPHNDANLIPLPAEYGALQGYDPSLLVVDELHVVTEEVWSAATSAAGKREESLTLAISTPASTEDSIMWALVKHGRSGEDHQFYFKEYAAPEGCATTDRDAWKIANPALACTPPFLAEDAIEAVRKTLREPVFRQLRLGQWAKGVDSWLPFGAWEALAAPEREITGKVVLSFDGSASGDSTALIGCTVGPDPHVWVEGLWQNPGDLRWRVPRSEVIATINTAFQKFDVLECAFDPWGWRSEIEELAKVHGERRVIEWNTAHAGRMAPATDRMYQAVMTKTLSHDGDERMAAHFAHAVAKSTAQGDLVTKDKRNSPRKIDAAVAAIVALDRAAWHHAKTNKRRVVGF
ncbi:terminase TerL endonuclease subunit [Micrococcus luteus]|uniref:terminase TerL endonuclease subunit n=1 Tax=Micrococcus TaxID=1269 RepID=UPI000BA566A0|nr:MULTISPECIES: terminase TerL endonuclease subunit [Micrococcus]MCV7506619.1 terminase large subunit [Micrococcus luteus]MCV7547603.1 terminase large subunit [Micrococcus luteus]MCV7619871.1 terminase large subunit [Micrococcus luteus]MCV7684524.1 terminase large subunit [Micrococcus luteus]MCV7731814.1 terminase large subunit [Micrococcus luteus]